MSVRKVLINSVWFGVIPKLSTFINMLILPIITPYLTASDFGTWGVISGYVSIFTSVSSLGLYVHLTNSYYEYRKYFRLIWSRLLFLILVASLICSIILFLIIYTSIDYLPNSVRILTSCLSVFPVLFSGNQLLAEHLFTLRAIPKPLVLRNLFASISGIVCSFVMIYYLNLGFIGFICGAAVNAFLAFVSFIPPLWIKEGLVPIVDHNLKRVKHLLQVSYPAIPHALGFIFLSSSARIVMDWYDIPLENIGLYTNGYSIGAYINIITGATVTAIVPQIQIAYRNADYQRFRKLYYFCQVVTMISIIAFVVWMPEIYDLLIHNEELKKSIEISQYSCFANAVYPFYVFLSTFTFIEKKTSQLLWLVFFPGVLNVTLCVILIPLLGYKIAVFTTIVSYWSQLFIPMFVTFHHVNTKKWLKMNQIIFIFLFLLICMITSQFTSHLNMILKVMFSIILAVITCCYLKDVAKNKVV